jgi:hypothetical protein
MSFSLLFVANKLKTSQQRVFIHSHRRNKMKIALNIIGSLLVLMGVIWFLQGINILPGSYMTGQIKWAINGALSFLIGAALVLLANWSKSGAGKKR